MEELLSESTDSLCRVLIAWEDVGRRLAAGMGSVEAWEEYDRLILEHRDICRRIAEIGEARP